MDPELRKELDALHALARDNHHLLRKVRRHQILETFGRYVLWLAVIALSYYSYVVYLAPLIKTFAAPAPGAGAAGVSLPTFSDLQKLLDSVKPK